MQIVLCLVLVRKYQFVVNVCALYPGEGAIVEDMGKLFVDLPITIIPAVGFLRIVFRRNSWKRTSWWRHQLKTFPALLALCEKEFSVDRWIPSQRPVRLCFDVFFDLRLNQRLNKQSRRWWFETSSRSSWRHCNVEHSVPCRKNPSLVTTKLDTLRMICIFLGYIFMYFPVSVTILTWRWINSKHFTKSKRIVRPRVSFSFYPRSVSSFIFFSLRLGSRYAWKYCLNICILFVWFSSDLLPFYVANFCYLCATWRYTGLIAFVYNFGYEDESS